jgi:cell wall-associated NlpC family hydrolase
MRALGLLGLPVVLVFAGLLLLGDDDGGRCAEPGRAGADAGWAVPLGAAYTLTSGFGHRTNPIGGHSELHDGQDLAAPKGTPVLAAGSGTVTTSVRQDAGGFGIHVVIDHGDGLSTLYGHLSLSLVDVGDEVVAGQKIGEVGSTGYSTGPHLHFTVKQDGRAIDPGPFMAARGAALDGRPGTAATPAARAMPCRDGRAASGTGSGSVVAAAEAQLGVPYSWGGGGLDGPTTGICCTGSGDSGARTVGFDCSGLTRYAVYQGLGVVLPRTVAEQLASPLVQRVPVDPAALRAGDLLFEGDHHIGVYDGLGGMIHAPQPGQTVVRVEDVFHSWHASQITAAGRVTPLEAP